MKSFQSMCVLLVGTALFCAARNCHGDERLSVTNALSSTTLGGYVDNSTGWNLNTNNPAPGFNGAWIGIVTDRAATNRLELYILVDEFGNFAGRAMNFGRTLGSDQFEGRLNRHGKARVDDMRFHFHENGNATVTGQGVTGRYITVRLLREMR